jgi:hypothetical protein
MALQAAWSADASPLDRSSLGWLILIPLGCLVLGQALLALTGTVPVFDGTLADPDSYMRLSRVLQLHETGSWFDSRFLRIDPPDGHVQHWTRPLDAILLAGAWLLQPALGFARALHLWGVLISPVCLALTVVALAWAATPLLDRDARLFGCLALLMQPTVLAYSSLGRPDHHSLLLLLFMVLFGLTVRLLTAPQAHRMAAAAGLVAALALWISPEALAFIAPSFGALGLCWLLGDTAIAARIQGYLGTFFLGLGAALILERGPGALLVIENDRLSLLHVALAGALFLGWLAIVRVERALIGGRQPRPEAGLRRGIALRACLGVAGALAIALAMLVLFPGLRRGPLGAVDPLYARLRLQHIVEIQPLIALDSLRAGEIAKAARRVLEVLGIALPALPFLGALLVRRQGAARRLWGYLALTLAIFLALALYQVRWSIYTQVLLVLPYSACVAWLLGTLGRRFGDGAAKIWRPLVIVAALFWPLLIVQLLPQNQIAIADEEACPLGRLAPALTRAAGGTPRTILAFADFGPEILYRTPLSVLSIPNHRPQPGFTASYRILTARDDSAARSLLAEYRVDWILLCPGPVEGSIFAPEGAAKDDLYQRLVDGAPPPPWLRPVPLEPALARSFRLFEVVEEPAVAGRAHDDHRPL